MAKNNRLQGILASTPNFNTTAERIKAVGIRNIERFTGVSDAHSLLYDDPAHADSSQPGRPFVLGGIP